MLLTRCAAVTTVLALTAATSGPQTLVTWPALLLIAYLAALGGCLAHRRVRRTAAITYSPARRVDRGPLPVSGARGNNRAPNSSDADRISPSGRGPAADGPPPPPWCRRDRRPLRRLGSAVNHATNLDLHQAGVAGLHDVAVARPTDQDHLAGTRRHDNQPCPRPAITLRFVAISSGYHVPI